MFCSGSDHHFTYLGRRHQPPTYQEGEENQINGGTWEFLLRKGFLLSVSEEGVK